MSELGDRSLVLELSKHAIARYGERVRPALSVPELEAELIHVLAHGQACTTPPPWLARGDQRSEAYLSLGDIVFPLVLDAWPGHALAVTCLARGTISPVSRRRRNAQRQARRRDSRGQPTDCPKRQAPSTADHFVLDKEER